MDELLGSLRVDKINIKERRREDFRQVANKFFTKNGWIR